MSSIALRMPSGATDVLANLYSEFHPRVLRLCQYLLGSCEDGEDAASEVFLRLPKALVTYDRAQPFWTWLASVTHHHCIDRLRARRSEQRVFEPAHAEAPAPVSPTASPLDHLLETESRDSLRAALAALPERYRTPLVLRYHHDLRYDQIASQLGLSRANVAIQVFRAKQQLRRALDDRPGQSA